MVPLAVVLLVGLTIAAIRTPLVRRIGLRNAVRRPREAALVMLGCVLGTALIVGSGAVADSFNASIRDQALAGLGPIDARVNYESVDDWAAANARLNASPIEGVAIAAAAATLEVPLTSSSGPTPAPRAKLIEVDYRRAGSLTASRTTAAGTGPTPGTAWVSRPLAERLNLQVDSVLTVHTKVPDQRLLVAKIVDSPLVTFVDNNLDTGDNLLVTPGTIAILKQQDPEAFTPRYLSLIGATGPHTKAAPDPATVERLRDRLTELVTPFNGAVAMVRADNLSAAKQAGDNAGRLLVTIGAFGIIAGIMLLVNVLLMLAEERMAELGTMRAVGLSRNPLIASFALEGAIYSIVGAALGGAAGFGLGKFMVQVAAGTTGSDTTKIGLPIHFALEPRTLLNGVAAGFVVSTIVVLATSFRVSRIDVIRALRSLPAPRRRHVTAATPLLIAGILAGPSLYAYGYAAQAAMPFLFSVPIFFACVGVLVGRRRGYVAAVSVACGPNIVWAPLFQILNRDSDAPASVTVIGGVLVVLSAVLFVNAQQGLLADLVRRTGRGRATVTTRLGLANPIAHRVRTLLTVAPFALVVFTLVYTESLSSLLVGEVQRIAPIVGGDYKVLATSSSARPFDFSTLDAGSVDAVAPTSTIIASFAKDADAQQRFWQVSAFSRDVARVDPPLLQARSKAYESDRAAYVDVAGDADLIIVPANFLFGTTVRVGNNDENASRGPEVGDSYTMFDPATGTARDVIVAGVAHADVAGSGAFYGETGAKQIFGPRLIQNSALIAARGDNRALATQLEQAGVENGLRVTVIEDATRNFYAYANDLTNLYRSDLGIGVVVGVAGIGVVLVRSVRDRRRQIGTLRAMGVNADQIGWSFLIEGGFVAAQGIAIGVGLGYVTVAALTQGELINQILGYQPDLAPPNVATLGIAIGLLVASILASVAPARSASRIPPAVALRLVD